MSDDLRQHKDLRDAGYAPGNYTFKCIDCEQEAVGDKRARRCLPCAGKRVLSGASPGTSNPLGLLPCPFCGCRDIDIRQRERNHPNDPTLKIECRDCEASLLWYWTAAEAARDWNKRTPLSGEPTSAVETGEKRAYYETHDPPHCPTCGCGMPGAICQHDRFKPGFTLEWLGSTPQLHANTHRFMCKVCRETFDLAIGEVQLSQKASGTPSTSTGE